MSEQQAAHAPAPAATGGHGGSWMLRACVLAFMLAVILGECLVAYLYLHSSGGASEGHGAEKKDSHAEKQDGHEKAHDEHAKPDEGHDSHGDAHGEEHKDEHGGGHGEHGKSTQSPQVEVDLGDFSVTMFQPASNTTVRIDFHLFGSIRVDDDADFKGRMEEHKHRFRDQVLVTIRSSDIADLADPGLGLIKRKILAKTNETLGKPLLRTVIFSEFSFIEQ